MQVDPDDIILATEGAKIRHGGSGPLLVTIYDDSNQSTSIEVPPGDGTTWYPPPGWRYARFTAPGHADEHREIEQAASAS
jgi:hypothetical protein